jgi:hypothetical protein
METEKAIDLEKGNSTSAERFLRSGNPKYHEKSNNGGQLQKVSKN